MSNNVLVKRLGFVLIILLVIVGVRAISAVGRSPSNPKTFPTSTPEIEIPSNGVLLRAKPWNDGQVHLWSQVAEGDVPYVDIPENTICDRLDDKTHKLGDGTTAIYFYKVNCQGHVGYVAVEQVELGRSSGPRVLLPAATRITEPANAVALHPTAIPTQLAPPTEVASFGVWGVVKASVLNVRESPSTDAPILGTLNAGQCVELVSEGEDWYAVATESIGGWSSSEYITPVAECPETPAATQIVAVEQIASEPTAATEPQVAVATSALPSYVGQPFATNATVARDGWFYECFGQGDNGMRQVTAGTPLQLLGVGDFAPTAEQQALLGSGPFFKIRIWDGQFGWLPASLMDADPLTFAQVPGGCAEYDSIDWTTVVRPDPTAVPDWARVVATPTSAPSWTPNTNPSPSRSCCKICTTGKACGNSCISRSYTCHKGPGCACNG